MTTETPPDLRSAVLAQADRLAALAPRHAAESEAQRTLCRPLIEALRGTDLLRLWVPGELGGLQASPALGMEAMARVAAADGSTAWSLGIATGCNGIAAPRVEPSLAKDMFGRRDFVMAGSASPGGRAEPVDGGYRVSGRWHYASGCRHADGFFGECVLVVDGQPVMTRAGLPETRAMLFQPDEVTQLDTWDAAGMRGTGSHDFTVDGFFVPERRSFSIWRKPYPYEGTLNRYPIGSLLAFNLAGIPLGLGRGAIDAFVALAREKTPTGYRERLAERLPVQARVAEAESLVRSARAFLMEIAQDTWETLDRGDELTIEQRALVRMATSFGAESCSRAVDLMFHLAGMNSVQAGHTIERAFRDIHTARQHFVVGPASMEGAGRVFLGLDPAALL
jgi:alkylation response protein AidB-like acyl-CoA dehydrogenase